MRYFEKGAAKHTKLSQSAQSQKKKVLLLVDYPGY